MTKTKQTSDEPAKQIYFVPGYGEIEAVDMEDVLKQVEKLKEQEDGDGNS